MVLVAVNWSKLPALAFGIDLGPLAIGTRLVPFPGGPLPVLNLVRFD